METSPSKLQSLSVEDPESTTRSLSRSNSGTPAVLSRRNSMSIKPILKKRASSFSQQYPTLSLKEELAQLQLQDQQQQQQQATQASSSSAFTPRQQPQTPKTIFSNSNPSLLEEVRSKLDQAPSTILGDSMSMEDNAGRSPGEGNYKPSSPSSARKRGVYFSNQVPRLTASELLEKQSQLGILVTDNAVESIADKLEQTKLNHTVPRRGSINVEKLPRRTSFNSSASSLAKSSAAVSTAGSYSSEVDNRETEEPSPLIAADAVKQNGVQVATDQEDIDFLNKRAANSGNILKQKVIYKLEESDLEGAELEGTLHLRSYRFLVQEKWRPRWCVLKDHRLFILKARDALYATNVINLKHCVLDAFPEKRDSFVIHRLGLFKNFYFQAESQEEKVRWMEMLLTNIYHAWKTQSLLHRDERFLTSHDFSQWQQEMIDRNAASFAKSDQREAFRLEDDTGTDSEASSVVNSPAERRKPSRGAPGASISTGNDSSRLYATS